MTHRGVVHLQMSLLFFQLVPLCSVKVLGSVRKSRNNLVRDLILTSFRDCFRDSFAGTVLAFAAALVLSYLSQFLQKIAGK